VTLVLQSRSSRSPRLILFCGSLTFRLPLCLDLVLVTIYYRCICDSSTCTCIRDSSTCTCTAIQLNVQLNVLTTRMSSPPPHASDFPALRLGLLRTDPAARTITVDGIFLLTQRLAPNAITPCSPAGENVKYEISPKPTVTKIKYATTR
jgi:hypothetical protein